MHSVQVTKTIGISAEAAWRIVDRFGEIANYHPPVLDSAVTNGQETGEGAERYCAFGGGNVIQERITAYRPGESMTIEITDTGRFPMRSAVAWISVAPKGEGQAAVTFRMDFVPRFGRLGWLMAVTVMTGRFRKVISGMIDGIETYGRTGKAVGRRAARVA